MGWGGKNGNLIRNVNLFHYVSFQGYESDKSDQNVTEILVLHLTLKILETVISLARQ